MSDKIKISISAYGVTHSTEIDDECSAQEFINAILDAANSGIFTKDALKNAIETAALNIKL